MLYIYSNGYKHNFYVENENIQKQLTNILIGASKIRISVGKFPWTKALSLSTSRSALCIRSTSFSFTGVDWSYWWAFAAKSGISSTSCIAFALKRSNEVDTSCVLPTRIWFTSVFVTFAPNRRISYKTSWTRTFWSMVSRTALSISSTNTNLLAWINAKTLIVASSIFRTVNISLAFCLAASTSPSISLKSSGANANCPMP